MRTWKHSVLVPGVTHDRIPQSCNSLICDTCGWMFSDHQDSVWTDQNLSTRKGYLCPSAPTVPGYPKTDDQSNTDTVVDRKSLLQNIINLQNMLGESNFRISNLLDQNSQATFQACEQQKKIKELELQVESSKHGPQCYPTRLRLEDQIRGLEKKIEDVKSFNSVYVGDYTDEIKSLKSQLAEADAGIKNLQTRADSDYRSAVRFQDELKEWKQKHYEKEKEILVVRDQVQELKKEMKGWSDAAWMRSAQVKNLQEQLQKKEKELEDTLKSKTISVHNYYESDSKWQLMKTAPRDGTRILAWFQGGTVIVRYDDREKYSKSGSDAYSPWAMEGGGLIAVTHWMSLPRAPKS